MVENTDVVAVLDEQRVMASFNTLFARFGSVDRIQSNPPLLAHYTSIKVMENILQSNEIWLSNPLFMNDLQEMRFGLSQGGRLFSNVELLKKAGGTDERAALLQHAFSHFYQTFENGDAFDTYVFCLSEHDRANSDGLLSMWRGYGEHGNGVALVFDTAKLTMVETSPLMIAQVSYGSDDDRLGELEKILNRWAEITEGSGLANDKLYLAAHYAFSVIKTYALTTKHRGFSEEVEWRVIYFPERDTDGALKPFLGYHIGERGVEPKLKYPVGHIANVSAVDLALERLLDRIILGPSVSSALGKRSVERMLEKINKAEFKERLHTSGIPLRPGGSSF
jgi:hypothetical protein